MTLPDYCLMCTHFDEGKCCHPDPFPTIQEIIGGEQCESFERNHDLDDWHPNEWGAYHTQWKFYVPHDGHEIMLDELRDFILGHENIGGFTEYQGKGVWRTPECMLVETATIIEVWDVFAPTRPNDANGTIEQSLEYMEVMSWLVRWGRKWGQDCVLVQVNERAILLSVM